MIRYSPQKSAVYRDAFGEDAAWSAVEHLLATVVDLLQVSVWMNSKDGQKNRNRPKPLARPGRNEPQAIDKAAGGTPGSFHAGGEGMTVDEFDAWWNSDN